MPATLPKLLYDNRFADATVTATDTAAGFFAASIADWRGYTFWKGASAGQKYLTVDCGTAKSADCLALFGHNFFTAGALVHIEHSANNSAWTSLAETYEALIADSSRNLIPDPSVSLDGGTLAYWDVFGGATYSTSGGYSDNGPCLKTYTSASGAVLSDAVTQDLSSLSRQPCVAGDIVVASARCKLSSDFSSTGQTAIGVNWHDAGGTYRSTSNVNCDKAILGDWQLVSVVATAPEGAAFYRFRAITYYAAGSTGHMLTDNIFLSKVNTPERVQSDGSVKWGMINDKTEMISFPATSARYWRVGINTAAIAAQVAVVCLGVAVTMPDYPDAPYTPFNEEAMFERSRSKSGHILGVTRQYLSESFSPTFSVILKTWVDTYLRPFWRNHASHGLPFFYSGNSEGAGTDCHFVTLADSYRFTGSQGDSLYLDSITLDMEGVVE